MRVQLSQFHREGPQHFSTGRRYQDIVFESYPPKRSVIEPGFHGREHSFLQNYLRVRGEDGSGLVITKSQAMAGYMREEFEETCVGNDFSRRPIDFIRSGSGLHGGHPCPLCPLDDFPKLALMLARGAGHTNPSAVSPV